MNLPKPASYTIVGSHHLQAPRETAFPSRRIQGGPEDDLVDSLIPQLGKSLRFAQSRSYIFREPRIAGQYPDLVVAIVRKNTFLKWSPARSTLSATDLKILHGLHNHGPATIQQLAAYLGFEQDIISRTLDTLEQSALVVPNRKKTYRGVSLRRTFGIDRLIAIEAKIGGISQAISQANRNSWFASESYVYLANRNGKAVTHISASHQEKVRPTPLEGLYLVEPPASIQLPISYASWMINEWVGRTIRGQMSHMELT